MDTILLEKIKASRKDMTDFFNIVSAKANQTDATVYELMAMRGYKTEHMYNKLKQMGVFKIDSTYELDFVSKDFSTETMQNLGILSKSGDFILNGRYVLPIKDIEGSVVALVGWYPDIKKYITTPTFGFMRDTSFFNLDCYADSVENHNGVVFLMEGIFDTLAVSSLGLPAIGNMGLEMSALKATILSRFSKVVAIHDNDKAGNSVDPYLNGSTSKGKRFIWDIPVPTVFVRLPKGVKDPDDLNVLHDFSCVDEFKSCIDANYIKRLK